MSHTSTADRADRHRQLFALSLLGVGLIQLIKAAEQVAVTELAVLLDYSVIGLAVLVVGLLLPAVVAKFRLPADQKIVYFSEDGYAAQLLRRAFRVSWAATFISLLVLEFVARDNAFDLEPSFYIQIGLFIMLAAMSGTFLVLNWSAGRDALGDDA
ncbi:MAG: hypothetical protein COV99_07485 [Bacteroidetes bacterium CG12_big_fil_rev_8_21_14_0_65_60_17]|nr:MAG: hypothetical protein COV99_07485 [Bacteroidetes bacterium CG12_big_fil_rev_8_21_14_0_65_60_17]